MEQTAPKEVTFTIAYLFCSVGGFAIGGAAAEDEYKGIHARFLAIGGIDSDPKRVRQFERLTGAPGHVLDLFSRQDYTTFHGHEPPEGWREATPADIRRIFGDEPPDAIYLSPPCKGFSGLLPKEKSKAPKHQALNDLFVRAIRLCLETWADDPVPIYTIENVPMIKTRGTREIAAVRRLFKQYGYEVSMKDHDLGKIGGLGQTRPRFKVMAIHRGKIPFAHIHEPPEQPLKTISQVLGPLPMPGDPSAGPLHRLPNLDFQTWIRLATIRPGGDWKDIPGPGEWRLMTLDGREIPPEAFTWAVKDKQGRDKVKWFAPDPTVWGRIFVVELLPGARHYPDVRLKHVPMGRGRGAWWVQDPDRPGGLVTADPNHRKSGGASALADGRLGVDLGCPDKPGRHKNHYRVGDARKPGGVATGADHLANGAPSMEDLRLAFRENRHRVKFHVQPPGDVGHTATGQTGVQTGAPVQMDLRLEYRENRHANKYGVDDPNRPSDTATGSDRLGSGAPSTADIRVGLTSPKFEHCYDNTAPDETAGTVAGGTGPSSGGHVTVDPRLAFSPWDKSLSVGDPDQTSPTVTSNTWVSTSNGPGAISQPELGMDCKPRNGIVGVVAWTGPGPAIIASLDVYAGPGAVEDRRFDIRVTIHYWPEWFPSFLILSPWNAWHRPLTDLDLAAVQSFPVTFADGSPFTLEGTRKEIRGMIGDAVPPLAAKAIAEAMLRTLLRVYVEGRDAWFLSPVGTPVWVREWLAARLGRTDPPVGGADN